MGIRCPNLSGRLAKAHILGHDERTVSRIPDALGFPSKRTGLPPMYFDSFLSSGSSVVFQEAAAAAEAQREDRADAGCR